MAARFRSIYGAGKLAREWASGTDDDGIIVSMMLDWLAAGAARWRIPPADVGQRFAAGLEACSEHCKFPPTLPEFLVESESRWTEWQQAARQRARADARAAEKRAAAALGTKAEKSFLSDASCAAVPLQGVKPENRATRASGPAKAIQYVGSGRRAAAEKGMAALAAAAAGGENLTKAEKWARHEALLREHGKLGEFAA